jgi:hypothetical protein
LFGGIGPRRYTRRSVFIGSAVYLENFVGRPVGNNPTVVEQNGAVTDPSDQLF